MNGKLMMNMAKVGFIFNFNPPGLDGIIYIRHNTDRRLTEFDRERIADVFPDDVVALMDGNKRIVVIQ